MSTLQRPSHGHAAGAGSLYWHGDGPLHRAPVWAKLLALAVLSTAVVWVGNPLMSGCVAGLGFGATIAIGVPGRMLWRVWRPILVVVVLIALVQVAIGRVAPGVDAASRVLAVAALALLFTLTTSAMKLVGWVERTLTRLGVRPERVFRIGLAVGLATRSVDHLGVVAHQVMDARRSRGLGRSARAFAVPTVVAAGRFAHGMGEALEARGLAVGAHGGEPVAAAPYRMVPALDHRSRDGGGATWIPRGHELGPATALPPSVPQSFLVEALAQCSGLFLRDHLRPERPTRWLLGAVYDTTFDPVAWGTEVALDCRLVQLSQHAARLECTATVAEHDVCSAQLVMVPFDPAGPTE